MLNEAFNSVQPVFPDLEIKGIPDDVYTAAEAALNRAIANGYNPALDDPYHSKPLPLPGHQRSSKRE